MGKTLFGALANAAGTLRARTPDLPVPFVGRAATYGAFGQRRDAEAQMAAMTATGTLFAIVDRTSNATALVEWKLWRTAKSGKKEDRVEVTSHAALDLWNKPNAFMPRQEFVESSTQHYDLAGETWWVIARVPGVSIPLEMWPVRPDRMMPVPSQEKFLAGYIYISPDGERIPLELNEVIQLRRPNPLDPYRGLSPVLSILPDLDTSRYAAEWSRSFFMNSAEPGGIIEVPGHLGDTEFDELRDRWNEQHKGVANAHRVAILEHGKWVDRKLSQRDMQFVELRGATRDAIREAYGIPKFAVGDLDDVNRAVAEAAKAWFAEQLTIPRLERIKAALNFELLPMYGTSTQGLEFDYENPVPPNIETEGKQLTDRASAVKMLTEAGAYGPAALAAVGLPDIPFGEPGADADKELLIKLVTRAPLLAPIILPMLGFQLPDGAAPASAATLAPAPQDAWAAAVAGLLGGSDGEGIEAAMRWEAVAHIDDNTCKPCADNDGTTYRNRAAAYKDYPGGSGYVKCVGAEHGNECRCKVVKRRKTRDDE